MTLEQQIQKNNKQLAVYFPLTESNDFVFKLFCKLYDLASDVVEDKATEQEYVGLQKHMLFYFKNRFNK